MASPPPPLPERTLAILREHHVTICLPERHAHDAGERSVFICFFVHCQSAGERAGPTPVQGQRVRRVHRPPVPSETMDRGPYAPLEHRLGHVFDRPELLRAALAHASYLNETHIVLAERSKRLAFLGDAVIELAVREHLMNDMRHEPHGALSRAADRVVRNSDLVDLAGVDGLDIGPWIDPGGSQGEAAREHPRVLADALEAIVGAIYLDCTDKTHALAAVTRLIGPLLARSHEWYEGQRAGVP